MAHAALQAKAESEAGWDTHSNMSGAAGGGSNASVRGASPPSHIRGSMSMGSLGQFSQAPLSPNMMAGMGMHGAPSSHLMYQQQQQSMAPASGRLPPFAPSLAMSQAMFQPSFYGYAGSALGVGGAYSGSTLGTGSNSAIGIGPGSGRHPGKRASTSVMGSASPRQHF